MRKPPRKDPPMAYVADGPNRRRRLKDAPMSGGQMKTAMALVDAGYQKGIAEGRRSMRRECLKIAREAIPNEYSPSGAKAAKSIYTAIEKVRP